MQATESTYDFWNILLFNSLTQFVTIFWNYLLAVAFVVKKIYLLLKSCTEELNCSIVKLDHSKLRGNKDLAERLPAKEPIYVHEKCRRQ